LGVFLEGRQTEQKSFLRVPFDITALIAAGGNNYPVNDLVKPPRCDAQALSPAGMFGGKAPTQIPITHTKIV
jgi:hypothetical protein